MNKNLAEDYRKEQEIRAAFEQAEEKDDQAGMDAAKANYKIWANGMKEESEAYNRIYREYAGAQERGNKYIDFSGVIYDEKVKDLIEELRATGETHFTFSSSWSSSVETAWRFTENGCSMEGMVKINGETKDWITGEYQKVPAFIFKLN